MVTHPTAGAANIPSGLTHMPLMVRDIMTTDPVSVGPCATIQEIAHTMLANDIRALPVVDIGEALVGIVTEADLLYRKGFPADRHRRLAQVIDDARIEHQHHLRDKSVGLTAAEVMTKNVVTGRPDEVVGVVARRLIRHDIRTMPIVDGDRLIGIVSRHDIVGLYDRPDSETRAQLARVLGDPLWSPDGHHVEATVRDGVVILEGTTRYPSDIPVIVAVVTQVPGVVEVVDRLQFLEPDPVATRGGREYLVR